MKTNQAKRVLSLVLILVMVMTLQPVWGQRTVKTAPVLEGEIIFNKDVAVAGEAISVLALGDPFDLPESDLFYDWYLADAKGNIIDHTQCQDDTYTPLQSDAGFYLVVTLSARGYSGEIKSDPILVKKKIGGSIGIKNEIVRVGETISVLTTGISDNVPDSAYHYTWQIIKGQGEDLWHNAGTGRTFVPLPSQKGMSLRVTLEVDGYEGFLTSKPKTIMAEKTGTIEFKPEKATVGEKVTVVLKGDYAELPDSSIRWVISRDQGKTWKSLNRTGKTYTPVADDYGAMIAVQLNIGGSAGTVQSKSLQVKKNLKMKVDLDYKEAVVGQPVSAKLLYNFADVEDAKSFNYKWYYLVDGASYWEPYNCTNPTLVPGEDLEGCNIRVKVTSPEYNGEVYSKSVRVYGKDQSIQGTAVLKGNGTDTGDVIRVTVGGQAANLSGSSLHYMWEVKTSSSDNWIHEGYDSSEFYISEEFEGGKFRVRVYADGLHGYILSDVFESDSTPYEPDVYTVKLSSAFTKVNETTYKYAATGNHINAKPLVYNIYGEKLTEGTDYKVEYNFNRRVNPGKYTIRVTGINGKSGTEVIKLIITPAAPEKVSGRLSKASGGYDDAYISWSASSRASGYQIYARRPSKSSKWSYIGRTTKTNFLEKNLYDGWKYEFKVVPYIVRDDLRYLSTKYRTASVTTLKKVSMTSVGKYNSSKVRVRWKNIASESGYEISRSTSKTGTYIVSKFSTTSGTSRLVSATRNKGYYYKIRAYKVVEGKKVYAPWSDTKYYKLR